jgi:hypothetical protein
MAAVIFGPSEPLEIKPVSNRNDPASQAGPEKTKDDGNATWKIS